MTSGLGSDLPGEGVTGVTSQQLHDLFNDGKHWDHKQMWAFQSSQLAQLLRHARTHVPFYKERLDCLFREDGSIDWRRWLEVPIVTRQDLSDHRADMLSPFLPVGHGGHGTSTSSGSTGRPINLEISSLAIYVASHAWNRAHVLHGLQMKRGLTEFKAYLPDGKAMTERILVLPATETTTQRTFLKRTLPTAEKLKLLAESQTFYLSDTPNHMEVLAHENLRISSPVKLEAVIGIGMPITPAQEVLFRRSFGARTFSPYSSKEGTMMAFQCPSVRSNYHVNAELVLFEVLDESGKPVPPGQPGRAVITPFFNAAQPLIRYQQGDIVVRGTCTCGLNLPVLSEIRGRSDAIFHFPGQMVALTRFDDNLLQSALQADAYQFAQVAAALIEVRYVSKTEVGTNAKEQVVAHLLEMLQVRDVNFTFRRMAEIPFNAGGKQQRITREFQIE